MILQSLSLQNFRNYKKKTFSFDPYLTFIIGPNASGKTNIVEAISVLSTGKSFRTSKEKQLIAFEQQIARINGTIEENSQEEQVEITLAFTQAQTLQKRYLINGVSKRRAGLAGLLPTVFFTPVDLALVSGQPGDKRRYLDDVLEQTDPDYASALQLYGKALRQRNALLEFVQKSGRRDEERFAYWDNLFITNGKY